MSENIQQPQPWTAEEQHKQTSSHEYLVVLNRRLTTTPFPSWHPFLWSSHNTRRHVEGVVLMCVVGTLVTLGLAHRPSRRWAELTVLSLLLLLSCLRMLLPSGKWQEALRFPCGARHTAWFHVAQEATHLVYRHHEPLGRCCRPDRDITGDITVPELRQRMKRLLYVSSRACTRASLEQLLEELRGAGIQVATDVNKPVEAVQDIASAVGPRLDAFMQNHSQVNSGRDDEKEISVAIVHV